MKESNKRSITKALSWRLTATLTTAIIVLILTGRFVLAFQIGLIEVAAKMILYFFHERLWNLVKWEKSHF